MWILGLKELKDSSLNQTLRVGCIALQLFSHPINGHLSGMGGFGSSQPPNLV